MKKKIKIALISFFSLIFLAIIVFILVLWLYPKKNIGQPIIITAEKVKDENNDDVSSYKENGLEVIYYNVYNFYDTFTFKDEGYIILDTASKGAILIDYNEYITVYKMNKIDDKFEQQNEIPKDYHSQHGLSKYFVADCRYVKIVFDSPNSDDLYNLAKIIVYC